MFDLRVTTWNVLHRIHAVNWDEATVRGFPDEGRRIERITETVRQWMTSGVNIVCLQEVSGDQLTSLRGSLEPRATIFHHRYPRVPKLRRGGDVPLADPHEYLVAITTSPSACAVGGQTFDSDPGKGFLALRVGGALVIGTHVSFGPRSAAQLAAIRDVACASDQPVVVVGDFNAEVAYVAAKLGADFALAALAGDRPTRVGTASSASHDIDHVAVRRGTISSAEVLEGGGLSDHNPVAASVSLY